MATKKRMIIIAVSILILTILIIDITRLDIYSRTTITCMSIRDMDYLMSSQTLVEMYIPQESVSREILYFKLINNSEYVFEWGFTGPSSPQLYWRSFGHWRRMSRTEGGFHLAIGLPSNTYVVERMGLLGYRQLPAGEYRLVMTVFLSRCFGNAGAFENGILFENGITVVGTFTLP